MLVEKKNPGCRAIGERVDEIENYGSQHAHIGENHGCGKHEKLQQIAAIGPKDLAEITARFGNQWMVALEHGPVHREVGDAAKEDDKNIHGFNINAFGVLVIWTERYFVR